MNTSSPSPSPEGQVPPREHRRASPDSSNLIRFCAIGLVVCFFLPWIQIAGQSLSGFDLQKMSGQQKWLWIIPVFSVGTMIRRCQKVIARLAGASPFFVLAYWLNQLGSDLLQALGLGAWLSLILGLALFILAYRLK